MYGAQEVLSRDTMSGFVEHDRNKLVLCLSSEESFEDADLCFNKVYEA